MMEAYVSIYTFIVICLFFFIGIISPKYRDKNKIQYLFIIMLLFWIAALRGSGNGDYYNYIERGQYINSIHDVFYKDIGMGIGYKTLAYIIKLLHLPRQTIIIAMNAISFLCLNKFIKRYSNHWSLSLLVFLPIFFQFEMHAARTGVAIAIISLGYKYIESRDFIRYFMVVLVASLFHMTAFIALILYFIYGKKTSFRKGLFIIAVAFIVVSMVDIDNIVLFLLNNLGMTYFSAKYVTYVNSVEYGYALSLLDPRIWVGVVIFVVASLFIKNKSEFEEFGINNALLYSFMLILLSEHTFIAYRVSSYFYYPVMTLVPSIISHGEFSKKDKRVRVVIFYGILICFTILGYVYASLTSFVEYIFFWNNAEAVLPWN